MLLKQILKKFEDFIENFENFKNVFIKFKTKLKKICIYCKLYC